MHCTTRGREGPGEWVGRPPCRDPVDPVRARAVEWWGMAGVQMVGKEHLTGRIDKQAVRRGNDASGFPKRQSACSGSTAISIPGQQWPFLWASQLLVACLESQVPIHAGPYVSLLEVFCLYLSSSLHFSLRIPVRPRHFPSDKPDFARRNHSLASIEVVPTKQPWVPGRCLIDFWFTFLYVAVIKALGSKSAWWGKGFICVTPLGHSPSLTGVMAGIQADLVGQGNQSSGSHGGRLLAGSQEGSCVASFAR